MYGIRLPVTHQLLVINEMARFIKTLLISSVFVGISQLYAQRVPILPQIDLPHNYYFRELYLPQLTSGPSSVTWSPDNNELVYSMAGSLWRQQIGSTSAYQLTDGPGYDYQPDWSPDGTKVVFSRYNGQSIELMLLELTTGKASHLTANQAVNIEPSWSPDGEQIAFVSTLGSGHFLLHKAGFKGNQLEDLKPLTADRKSEVKRYYYSNYDHGINPTWSPDGERIYFISNQEVAHGTGNIVFINADQPGSQMVVHKEETSWRTQPDISPDGSRMVYSSYLGRNWHQLWLLPTIGGHPLPLTYGDYDNTAPKWSPDGKRIAFISNREGNTSLWLIDSYTGRQEPVLIDDLRYLRRTDYLTIKTQDENGVQLVSSLSVTDSEGKFYAPKNAWVHGDDAIFANEKFEYHYFHSPGVIQLSVPRGTITIRASKGPDFKKSVLEIKNTAGMSDTATLTLEPIRIPPAFGNWKSGDLHVHMNYTGSYRNRPERLSFQAEAENLDFVYNLIVNKEQRIPDISYFSKASNAKVGKEVLILQGQEYHTSFWGHLGLLNLTQHYLLPDYSGYPQTAAESLFPHNSFIADRVHEQDGLVGYVHPFLDSDIFPEQSETLTNALPIDAALRKIDYYELIGFAHHRASEAVWHKLLNCGLRIPAGAGTDAMANYASLRGPLGLNRIYIQTEEDFDHHAIIDGIRDGKSFVTNGPLIGLKAAEVSPGSTLTLDRAGQTLNFEGFLRSSIAVEFLEVVWNGQVVKKVDLKKGQKNADFKGSFRPQGSGWLLLRAGSSEAHPDIPDFYPFASTNPIYVDSPGSKVQSKSAGLYFLTWLDRLEAAILSNNEFRNEEEKNAVLTDIESARKFYQSCVANSTMP